MVEQGFRYASLAILLGLAAGPGDAQAAYISRFIQIVPDASQISPIPGDPTQEHLVIRDIPVAEFPAQNGDWLSVTVAFAKPIRIAAAGSPTQAILGQFATGGIHVQTQSLAEILDAGAGLDINPVGPSGTGCSTCIGFTAFGTLTDTAFIFSGIRFTTSILDGLAAPTTVGSFSFEVVAGDVAVTPLPPALALMGAALAPLALLARRRRSRGLCPLELSRQDAGRPGPAS